MAVVEIVILAASGFFGQDPVWSPNVVGGYGVGSIGFSRYFSLQVVMVTDGPCGGYFFASQSGRSVSERCRTGFGLVLGQLIPFVIGVIGCFQVNGPGVVGNCAAVASYIVGVGYGFAAGSLYSCQAVEAVIGIGGCSCCIGDTGRVV